MVTKINDFEKFCRDYEYEVKDLDCLYKLIDLGFKPAYQDNTITWPLFVNEFDDDTGIIIQIPFINLKNAENNRRVGRYQLIDYVTETYDIVFVHNFDEFTEHYNVARIIGENMKKPEMESIEHFKTGNELLAFIKE